MELHEIHGGGVRRNLLFKVHFYSNIHSTNIFHKFKPSELPHSFQNFNGSSRDHGAVVSLEGMAWVTPTPANDMVIVDEMFENLVGFVPIARLR